VTDTKPYRSSVRAAALEATRERIVEAAMAAFFSGWYEDVTLRGIAKDADVALQTVRNHFATKEELFAVAAEEWGSRIATTRWSVTPGDVAGAIRVLVDDYERTGQAALRMQAVEERLPIVRPTLDRGRQGHESWCAHVFGAALEGLDVATRRRRLAQLVVATDVHTWQILRRDKGFGRETTITAMRELVLALHTNPEEARS
jgi:AcrR family transcriptional regulator